MVFIFPETTFKSIILIICLNTTSSLFCIQPQVFFAIMIHLSFKKYYTKSKKIINHVVSQFHLRQLILFFLASHFGNLNFGMITENIERCHTYHELNYCVFINFNGNQFCGFSKKKKKTVSRIR